MAKSSPSTETFVALLRGINVGGKNKLPMVDLLAMFTECGCTNAQHYIQSGNVIFRARPNAAARACEQVTVSIAKRFGYDVPLVLRRADEIADVVRNNPFDSGDVDVLHVMFLADPPSRERLASLDAQRSPPDSFRHRGREIYLRLPNGAGRTKFTNGYFDSKLATTSTQRNWRTVLKLVELATAAS
jgi:uncharacterized protein (DUF1697 family)